MSFEFNRLNFPSMVNRHLAYMPRPTNSYFNPPLISNSKGTYDDNTTEVDFRHIVAEVHRNLIEYRPQPKTTRVVPASELEVKTEPDPLQLKVKPTKSATKIQPSHGNSLKLLLDLKKELNAPNPTTAALATISQSNRKRSTSARPASQRDNTERGSESLGTVDEVLRDYIDATNEVDGIPTKPSSIATGQRKRKLATVIRSRSQTNLGSVENPKKFKNNVGSTPSNIWQIKANLEQKYQQRLRRNVAKPTDTNNFNSQKRLQEVLRQKRILDEIQQEHEKIQKERKTIAVEIQTMKQYLGEISTKLDTSMRKLKKKQTMSEMYDKATTRKNALRNIMNSESGPGAAGTTTAGKIPSRVPLAISSNKGTSRPGQRHISVDKKLLY